MTYQASTAKANRQPLNIVELDFDTKISAAGVEYLSDGPVPLGQAFYPCVEKIAFAPVRLEIAQGLGYRGTVRIRCRDFNYGSVGTYFGRLLGSNPYWLDRKIKIHNGFYDGQTFSWGDFQTRLYFIKRIDGPDENGWVNITAADIQTKLDGDQANVPAVEGSGNLAGSLAVSATGTVNINDNAGFSALGGYCVIDDEICSYSGISGADSIVISARGQYGSENKAHDADAPVRLCYVADGDNVVDIIYDLIDNYTAIDASTYINSTDWNTEKTTYLSGETARVVITEPTPVADVIKALAEQFYLAIWWDDVAQLIRMQAVGPTLTPAVQINTTAHILNTGHKKKWDQSKAITQVWVYFGMIDHTGDDDAENFSELYIAENGSDNYDTAKIKKIYARYVTASATASKIANRLISQNKGGELIMQWQLDAKDAVNLNVGDTVEITTDLHQGGEGIPVPTNFFVIEKDHIDDTVYAYTGVYAGIEVGDRYGVWAPDTVPDYLSASTAEKNTYVFLCNDSDQMSNGDDPYLLL